MTSLRDQELPPIASIGDLVKALRLLGVGVGIDESVPTVGHELAYSLIGAAERNAIMADHRAKATAPDPPSWPSSPAAHWMTPPTTTILTPSHCSNGARPVPPKRSRSWI